MSITSLLITVCPCISSDLRCNGEVVLLDKESGQVVIVEVEVRLVEEAHRLVVLGAKHLDQQDCFKLIM